MQQQSSFEKVLTVLLGLSLFLGEGLNCAQLGPFFATEASVHKHVSTTFIGVITGAFDVANFVGTILLASILTPDNQKFFFCTGALLTSICSGLFGVMGYSVGGAPYIIVCILIRILRGAGSAMVWSSSVALLVPIYPKWSGRITSLIETSDSLGLLIGPIIGSFIYTTGGYAMPFIFAASFETIIGVICIFRLPNNYSDRYSATGNSISDSFANYEKREEKTQNSTDDSGLTFAYFSTHPTVLLCSLPVICHAVNFGFIDVAVGPYLLGKFGVKGDTRGYYFLAYTGMQTVSSLMTGWLIDRGHAGRIYLISGLGASLGFLMLSLPGAVPSIESEVWLIIWLVILGATSAGGFTAIYLLFETIAYDIGFRNKNSVKLMSPCMLNACFGCGRILGPVFVGGLFMEYCGYYYSCLLLSGLFLISSLLCGQIMLTKGMLNKIFYKQDEANCLKDNV